MILTVRSSFFKVMHFRLQEIINRDEDMEENKPYKISESAETKYYCACGKSQNLPYCDGSHKGSVKQPYEVDDRGR
jgi:CDGSH-type Zn-finger protein